MNQAVKAKLLASQDERETLASAMNELAKFAKRSYREEVLDTTSTLPLEHSILKHMNAGQVAALNEAANLLTRNTESTETDVLAGEPVIKKPELTADEFAKLVAAATSLKTISFDQKQDDDVPDVFSAEERDKGKRMVGAVSKLFDQTITNKLQVPNPSNVKGVNEALSYIPEVVPKAGFEAKLAIDLLRKELEAGGRAR